MQFRSNEFRFDINYTAPCADDLLVTTNYTLVTINYILLYIGDLLNVHF
jgi:hypothetical protein